MLAISLYGSTVSYLVEAACDHVNFNSTAQYCETPSIRVVKLS